MSGASRTTGYRELGATRRRLLALLLLALALLPLGSRSPTAEAASQLVCSGFMTSCGSLSISPASLADIPRAGSGVITSSPAGIDCTYIKGVQSGTCSHVFNWPRTDDFLVVTLTATATGSVYCKAHVCGPTPHTEVIWLSPLGTHLIRGFQLIPYALTVSKTGEGTGSVTSDPAGIDCGVTCSKDFDYGTGVTLHAKPDQGATFKVWTGACSGQGANCTLTIAQATTTNAVFALPSGPPTTTTTTPTTPPSPPPRRAGRRAGRRTRRSTST